MPEESTYPVAARRPVERTHHGDTFVDDYEWLRDKESPDTIAYLEAENAYTESRTAHLEPLRQPLFDEIKTRTQETDLSVPSRIGSWWYYGRIGRGQAVRHQLPLSRRAAPTTGCRRPWTPAPTSPARRCCSTPTSSPRGTTSSPWAAPRSAPTAPCWPSAPTPSATSATSSRSRTSAPADLLPDQVPGTLGGATWDLKGSVLFYSTVDESWRPDKVWRHTLGSPVSEDVVVHHETDERFWTSVGRTRSDRFLMVVSGSKLTTEVRVLEADDPHGDFRVLAPRREGVEYGVEHAVISGDDWFLVLHNEDAENYALSRAPVDTTSHDQWEPLLPHDPAVRLEDVDAFATHLVVSQRSGGLTQLRVLLLDDQASGGIGEDFQIPFEEPVYTVGTFGNPEFAQPNLRLGYTTMTTPPSVYAFDVRHPGAAPCSSRPRCSRTRPWASSTPTATSSTASGPPPRTAPGCPSPWSARRTPPATAACRCCSTATAPTRARWTPTSRSRGSRCSTAGWASRSPTSVAAARWAGTGTTTARCSTR